MTEFNFLVFNITAITIVAIVFSDNKIAIDAIKTLGNIANKFTSLFHELIERGERPIE